MHSFLRLKKNLTFFFAIYFYIYTYLYIYLYIYIYIYISIYIYCKKERNVLRSLAKERNILAFIYVLCKRTLRLLRFFPFFSKWNVLLGCISCQKLEKRTEKNGTFFKRTEKNGTIWTEKNAVPNPEFFLHSNLWDTARRQD